jgi:hypothetical protein
MCTVLLSPGVSPITVNSISYHFHYLPVPMRNNLECIGWMFVAFCCNPFISRGNNVYRHANVVHSIYTVFMREGNQHDAVLRNNVCLGSKTCPSSTDIIGLRVPTRNTREFPLLLLSPSFRNSDILTSSADELLHVVTFVVVVFCNCVVISYLSASYFVCFICVLLLLICVLCCSCCSPFECWLRLLINMYCIIIIIIIIIINYFEWPFFFKMSPTGCPRHQFVGAFAKLQNTPISFVMSIRPSVSTHGTTRLPLDGFSWNFIFEYFSKICWENSSFIKSGQE